MKQAFTMAEILLSLTIIGVVAAITLPSLTGNINERTWNTQRKALYARMSQAISLMPALNGYGTLVEGNESTSAVDTATETFITDGLSKVLKINNICDSEHLGDCGIPNSITTLGGTKLTDIHTDLNHLTGLNPMFNSNYSYENANPTYRQVDTKAAAFETANGESVIAYYAPKCISELPLRENNYNFVQPYMCANFIYDLNGNKGPNTVGKDIGVITILYPTDSKLAAPLPISNTPLSADHGIGFSKINKLCSDRYGEEYRGPIKEDLAALFINKRLFELPDHYGTLVSTTKELSSNGDFNAWKISIQFGGLGLSSINQTSIGSVYCVKRN